MADAAKEFKGALLKFQADTDDAVDAIVRGVAQYAVGKVMEIAPVGNPTIWKVNVGKPKDKHQYPPGYVGGRFKGNWQVTVNQPAEGEVPDIDPSGAATLAKAALVLSAAPRPREVWLTNNLPYSEELESGHSRQAPLGIVAVTMAGIGDAFDQQAAQALGEKGLS